MTRKYEPERIADLNALREEPEAVSDRLHEPDDGEERREPDRNEGQGPSHPTGVRRSRDDGDEGCEREQEVRELVLGRVQVLRPEERERREGEEGDGRECDERGNRSHFAPAQSAPGERERGRAEHGVERKQSPELPGAGGADVEAVLAPERERRTERRGDEHERRHGYRVAHEDRSSESHDSECRDAERCDPRRGSAPAVGELEHEHDLGSGQQGEPREQRPPAPGEQNESSADRPEQRRNLGRISRIHAGNGKQPGSIALRRTPAARGRRSAGAPPGGRTGRARGRAGRRG